MTKDKACVTVEADRSGAARLNPRVICVDDDPRILAALRRTLRREPYEIVTTADPFEVLTQLSDGRPTMVIADLRMPGMSGLDLIREVQARHPDTAHLLLTGYPEVACALSRNLDEREGVMAKPWDEEQLKQVVLESFGPLSSKQREDAGTNGVSGGPGYFTESLLSDVERALDRARNDSEEGDNSGS